MENYLFAGSACGGERATAPRGWAALKAVDLGIAFA
jgi:hypothetical protein